MKAGDVADEHVKWAWSVKRSVKFAAHLCGIEPWKGISTRDLTKHVNFLYRSLEVEMDYPTKITCQWAFTTYNELAKDIGLPVARAFTDKRHKHLRARLKEIENAGENVEKTWRQALDNLEASKFCRGQNERAWKADLDFILQPSSFWRLVEGRYNGDTPKTQPPGGKSALEILRERYPGQY